MKKVAPVYHSVTVKISFFYIPGDLVSVYTIISGTKGNFWRKGLGGGNYKDLTNILNPEHPNNV